MELRHYFGERFDQVIETFRKEDGLSQVNLNPMDKIKIEQLLENMTGKKEPMPESSRAYLRDLFSEDIELLKSCVDFDVTDWK